METDRWAKMQMVAEVLRHEDGRTVIFVQKKATADWVRKPIRVSALAT